MDRVLQKHQYVVYEAWPGSKVTAMAASKFADASNPADVAAKLRSEERASGKHRLVSAFDAQHAENKVRANPLGDLEGLSPLGAVA